MAYADTNQTVSQNLMDAGCEAAFIEKYFSLETVGRSGEQTALLAVHRKALLEQIHQLQKALDCLDYLIYTLKKKGD